MPKLTKRGNIWWYSFIVGGARVRRSSKTADKAIAQDIAAKEEWRHRHAAVHGPGSVLTFGEAMALYVDHTKDDRFLLPLLDRWENVKVAEMTADAIRQAAQKLYRPPASDALYRRPTHGAHR